MHPGPQPQLDPGERSVPHAYPDQWEVHFGLDPKVIDQRLIQSSGNDQTAIQRGPFSPRTSRSSSPTRRRPRRSSRAARSAAYDPYCPATTGSTSTRSRTSRSARRWRSLLTAKRIRKNAGGDFARRLCRWRRSSRTSVMTIAETGFWDDLLRTADPGHGRPGARQEADRRVGRGSSDARLQLRRYADLGKKTAAIVIASLGRGWHHGHAGADRARPVLQRRLRSRARPATSVPVVGELTGRTLRPSSPPLFTQKGGWDLSQVDDPDVNAEVDAAIAEPTVPSRAHCGRPSTRRPCENVWVIPTFFELTAASLPEPRSIRTVSTCGVHTAPGRTAPCPSFRKVGRSAYGNLAFRSPGEWRCRSPGDVTFTLNR